MKAYFLLLTVTLSLVGILPAAPPTSDIVFAKADDETLRLNLFLPEKSDTKPPLVISIHGGGWKAGSYKNCQVRWLPKSGYAVASIDYRLSDKAKWPAQVHDCKAAIRWLRAHQDEYGYDASRIAVTGDSAGAYLALMLGVTGDEKEFEGEIGGNPGISTRVDAIVDFYGPTDFFLRSRSQPHKTEKPGSSVFELLGVSSLENPDLAKLASPAFHVTAHSPPLLILHGDKDVTVKLEQSQRMLDEYAKAGRKASMIVVPGGGHGGEALYTLEIQKKVIEFLDSVLRTPTAN